MLDVEKMPDIVPEEDREWFVLFSICVAGKTAKQTRTKINLYLDRYPELTPFEVVKRDIDDGQLREVLQYFKFGQYNRIEAAFRSAAYLNIKRDLNIDTLQRIKGIGPKTARFIVLYTDPKADCAVLDTHILKYLQLEYPWSNVPRSTPTNQRTYSIWEEKFKYLARQSGKTVRQLDTEVWQSYAKQ